MTHRPRAKESARDRRARHAFYLLASLLVTCVLVELLFAGFTIFPDPRGWVWHRNVVRAFDSLPLVLMWLAFAGRLAAPVRRGAAAAFGLVALQYTTVGMGGYIAALHPVNALLRFARNVGLARKAGATLRAE